MTEGLDVARIRPRFSALGRQVGRAPAVYLDGPGGSQTPDTVARAVGEYLLGANANAGGPFACISRRTGGSTAPRSAPTCC